jgi:hypothetical protein
MVIYPMMAICLSAEILSYLSKHSTCMCCKPAGGSLLTALTSRLSRIFVIDRLGVVCCQLLYLMFEYQVWFHGLQGPCTLGRRARGKRIRQCANNRLGAVYSALYSFWSARHATIAAGQQLGSRRGFDSVYSALYSALWSTSSTAATADQQGGGGRRDAYSVILFNNSSKTVLTNDFTSTPDQLLDVLLNEHAGGGTNFTMALDAGRSVMLQHWSAERLV